MSRVKRGATKRKRHKKILSLAKGAQGSRSVLFRTANQQVMHSLKYGYTHRALKKRMYRQLWITRINAIVRQNSGKYSTFMHSLRSKNIVLNRKMLSQLAVFDKKVFLLLCEE
jgi:large subunit ribosomal protein L20|tara:strand:- start:48317 stop:48655 length:339 start_codon:yes stop_codon:yes gene_type:complete